MTTQKLFLNKINSFIIYNSFLLLIKKKLLYLYVVSERETKLNKKVKDACYRALITSSRAPDVEVGRWEIPVRGLKRN